MSRSPTSCWAEPGPQPVEGGPHGRVGGQLGPDLVQVGVEQPLVGEQVDQQVVVAGQVDLGQVAGEGGHHLVGQGQHQLAPEHRPGLVVRGAGGPGGAAGPLAGRRVQAQPQPAHLDHDVGVGEPLAVGDGRGQHADHARVALDGGHLDRLLGGRGHPGNSPPTVDSSTSVSPSEGSTCSM